MLHKLYNRQGQSQSVRSRYVKKDVGSDIESPCKFVLPGVSACSGGASSFAITIQGYFAANCVTIPTPPHLPHPQRHWPLILMHSQLDMQAGEEFVDQHIQRVLEQRRLTGTLHSITGLLWLSCIGAITV